MCAGQEEASRIDKDQIVSIVRYNSFGSGKLTILSVPRPNEAKQMDDTAAKQQFF